MFECNELISWDSNWKQTCKKEINKEIIYIIKSQINIFYNKNVFQGIKLNDKSLVLTVSKWMWCKKKKATGASQRSPTI